MIEERSAGAVVFYDGEKGFEYLLLNYAAGHWDFPKGNIEKDESDVSTVRREINEETGIDDISFIPGFKRKVEYYYKRDGKLVHKVVIFYLVQAHRKDVKLSHEHLDYSWLSYDEAIKRATFENTKRILKEADEFLKDSRAKRSLDTFLQQPSEG
ncbi:MAG: NUDIX domain-containing protein [Nitrososphaerota archaeon]|nr:NUDIX domain-containing protein [Nitrososphaerales archaeon]MDW8044970.1 NUDIX domain-containing protein [Nitrososphaerota archaeon]